MAALHDERAAERQQQLLRSFLQAQGDLPVTSGDALLRAAPPMTSLPPSTPWVNAGDAAGGTGSAAAHSPHRAAPRGWPGATPTSPPVPVIARPVPRPPRLPPTPSAQTHAADSWATGAQATELARALAEARTAQLERQRLHRLCEMHAAAADEAFARAARLEAQLAAARAAEAHRVRTDADREAAMVAARARLAELEAMEGARAAAYEGRFGEVTQGAIDAARAARDAEASLRAELGAARRDAAEARAREEALQSQLIQQVPALRRERDEARAAAERVVSEHMGAAVASSAAASDARRDDAALVARLQREVEEARAREAAARADAERSRRAEPSGGASGGGGGGSAGAAAEAAVQQLEAQRDALLSARQQAERQLSSLQAQLADALGREEALQAQLGQALEMGRESDAELERAHARMRTLEKVLREERRAGSDPAAGGAPPKSGPEAEPGGGRTAAPAAPGVGARTVADPSDGRGRRGEGGSARPAAAPEERHAEPPPFLRAQQAGQPADAAPPTRRANLAPPARVPFATDDGGTSADERAAARARLEQRHMQLSLERDRLQAEFSRMPISSGRTLEVREKKAALETRLEALNAELGDINLRLRV